MRAMMTSHRVRILIACASPLLLVGTLLAALLIAQPFTQASAHTHKHRASIALTPTTLTTATAGTTPTPGATSTAAPTATPALPTAPTPTTVPASPPVAGLHVQGNQLISSTGQLVRFHGVNLSGPEYACIQGWGIFDGPSDAASVQEMTTWHINSVRVLLNEDCWLGINGVDPQYGGATYRSAIVNYVALLHQYGLSAELSLIWGAPGSNQATYQPGSPDEDHSPAMWASLAATFKGDSNVILAPWGETVVDAGCFLNGGVCEATYGSNNTPYQTAGMQQAVNVMRGAGYTGPIAIPCIDYANDCSQWLTHMPNDPLHQLVAEFHEYGDNTCADATCWNSQELPVLQQVPLLTGELGESVNGTCSATFIDTYMAWADAHGVSYQGWTWDTWGNCGVLITDFNGTPTSGFGQGYRAHLAQLGG